MESEDPQFWNAEYSSSFTLEELRNADRETQKEVIRNWFFANYEDPAERTPYESREGGYIYIWGGPYDAHEEISGVFEGYVPDDVIQELVDELERYCVEWTSAPRDDDYDDYYSSVLLSNTEFHKTLVESLERVKALLDVEVDEQLRQHYLRLLHVSVISALESFLSDGFIITVMSAPTLLRKFVETNRDFTKQKFALSELFQKVDVIEDEVKRYLSSLMWHNLEKIKPMYKETLDIELQEVGLCASMLPHRVLRPLDSPVRGLGRGSRLGGRVTPNRFGPSRPGPGGTMPSADSSTLNTPVTRRAAPRRRGAWHGGLRR